MELGIFAKTFIRPSLTETLDAVGDSGLGTMQFNVALAGGPSMPDEIPPKLASRIRSEASSRGLRMAAVSGTYNMAHPATAVTVDAIQVPKAEARAFAIGSRSPRVSRGRPQPGCPRWKCVRSRRERWSGCRAAAARSG